MCMCVCVITKREEKKQPNQVCFVKAREQTAAQSASPLTECKD